MANKNWDALYINSCIATLEEDKSPYGLIKNAGIAVKDNIIAWVGGMHELTEAPEKMAKVVYDHSGCCITPGLIDCHTHLVYAGNRSHEFEMRLQGVSYESIARSGGGIRSTVDATRAASESDLLKQSLVRARSLLLGGVTTLEIKSGYGLDLASELKILRVAKRLGELLPLTVKKTFLGAHTLPPEYQIDADKYIDLVCQTILPAVAKANLADAVDVFCEKIAFNLDQTESVFKAAQQFKLPIKCHAEQLSDFGSAELAAKYQALSVDHLEYLTETGVAALAKSGTVAVLLPGAFYYLREKQLPPVKLLRQYGVPIAIATDCNPGTSPVTLLLLMLNMASILLGLTCEEALVGVTRNAAKALGLGETHGTLTVGKQADFAIWDIEHPVELVSSIGLNPLVMLVKAGNVVDFAALPKS